jgi:hypothetical protein
LEGPWQKWLWPDALIIGAFDEKIYGFVVRFEVFTAVTMKNGIFLDVTPCGFCKNRHFGGT